MSKDQFEREALQRQVGGSNYLSDLRERMFGTRRRSEIIAKLDKNNSKRYADAMTSYVSDSTNKSALSGNIQQDLRDFHTNDTYLIQAIQSLPGLVAYYPLNEESGDAINYAPATLGTLDGTVTGATQGQVGQLGKAYSFDGVNDDVTIGTIATLDNFTILFLIKTTTTATGDFVLGVVEDGTNELIQIGLNSSETESAVANKTSTHIRLNATVSDRFAINNADVYDGNFHLHTLVRTGGTPTYYLDGVSQALTHDATSLDTQQLTLARPFAFGARNNRGTIGAYSDIQMQHVAIIQRALTAGEILRLAQIAGLA